MIRFVWQVSPHVRFALSGANLRNDEKVAAWAALRTARVRRLFVNRTHTSRSTRLCLDVLALAFSLEGRRHLPPLSRSGRLKESPLKVSKNGSIPPGGEKFSPDLAEVADFRRLETNPKRTKTPPHAGFCRKLTAPHTGGGSTVSLIRSRMPSGHRNMQK